MAKDKNGKGKSSLSKEERPSVERQELGEGTPKKELDLELDQLEERINDLKLQYEQYFLDIVTQPPDKLHQEVILLVRRLQSAPFKNSANNFRMKTLTHRFQTFETYWKRIVKERAEGRYRRDVFKAKIRQSPVKD